MVFADDKTEDIEETATKEATEAGFNNFPSQQQQSSDHTTAAKERPDPNSVYNNYNTSDETAEMNIIANKCVRDVNGFDSTKPKDIDMIKRCESDSRLMKDKDAMNNDDGNVDKDNDKYRYIYFKQNKSAYGVVSSDTSVPSQSKSIEDIAREMVPLDFE